MLLRTSSQARPGRQEVCGDFLQHDGWPGIIAKLGVGFKQGVSRSRVLLSVAWVAATTAYIHGRVCQPLSTLHPPR